VVCVALSPTQHTVQSLIGEGGGLLIYYVKSPYVCVEICLIFTYLKNVVQNFQIYFFKISTIEE